MTIDKAKFRKPVLPGDRVEFHMRKLNQPPQHVVVRGKAKVDGVLVCEAEIGAMLVPERPLPDGAGRSVTSRRPLLACIRWPSSRAARSSARAFDRPVLPRRSATWCLATASNSSRMPSLRAARRIGARTRIFPFASIGHAPQDLQICAAKPRRSTIGADCIIREGVTINPGTAGGRMATTIGDRCTLLAHSHVAHDCRLGDDVLLANNVMLAGHVERRGLCHPRRRRGRAAIRAHRRACISRRPLGP